MNEECLRSVLYSQQGGPFDGLYDAWLCIVEAQTVYMLSRRLGLLRLWNQKGGPRRNERVHSVSRTLNSAQLDG